MFEQELTQLATAIRTAVITRKQSGLIPTLRQVRVRRRNFTLKYEEDFGFANFPPERIEENIWDWRDQIGFQDSVVKGLPEYKSLVSALGSRVAAIDSFAGAVTHASFHGLEDAKLSEQVTALRRELERQSLPVKVTAFFNGLSISESPLRISNQLSFRKPTPEDVTEYILLDEYGGFSIPLGETHFRTVGEFVCDAISTGAAQQEFLRTVEALRLFRVGGISANRYEMRSGHSFPGGVGTLWSPDRHSRFPCLLSNADIPKLSAFLRDITPLLSPYEEGTSEKEIAHMRYKDALFQGGPSERSITSAITALEALLLSGETELTHRLSQRVSVFLRALGTQPNSQSTYETVKRGYKIRSKYIHGASVSTALRPQADASAPILLDYARQCTLAFFQMVQSKDDVIEKIDRAAIDPAGVTTLESSLACVVHK